MPKAFQKVYTKLVQITKATVSLRAENVGNDEMALVAGRPAQVVKMIGDIVTLQVFQGTEGIPTNAEVVFLGRPPRLKVSELLAGRFFNAYGVWSLRKVFKSAFQKFGLRFYKFIICRYYVPTQCGH